MGKALSQEFIEKQRERLLQEKKKIEKEIEDLRKEDPFSDPERLVDNKEDEDAREEIGHETIMAQVSSLEATLKDINIVLERIEKGEYGKCEICGREIGIERLEIAPASRFCIECQRKME